MAGPGTPWPGLPVDQGHCSCVDGGNDNDVDLVDYAIYQQVAATP